MNFTYHFHVKKSDETHVMQHLAGLESENFIKLASYISFAQNMWTTCY